MKVYLIRRSVTDSIEVAYSKTRTIETYTNLKEAIHDYRKFRKQVEPIRSYHKGDFYQNTSIVKADLDIEKLVLIDGSEKVLRQDEYKVHKGHAKKVHRIRLSDEEGNEFSFLLENYIGLTANEQRDANSCGVYYTNLYMLLKDAEPQKIYTYDNTCPGFGEKVIHMLDPMIQAGVKFIDMPSWYEVVDPTAKPSSKEENKG